MHFHFEVMSGMFFLEQFDAVVSSKDIESVEGRSLGKHAHLYGKRHWGELGNADSFSEFGFHAEGTTEDGLLCSRYQQEHRQQLLSDFGILEDLYLDIVSLPFQSSHEQISKLASIPSENSLNEPKKEKPYAIPLASLEILKNYRNRFRRLNGEKIKTPSCGTTCTKPQLKEGGRKLSTEDILRLAGEKFVQSSSQKVNDLSMLSHPFGSSFLNLTADETKDVILVQNLLSLAEKVSQQQYDRARKILSQCDNMCSDTGNPVERVVYYFSKALRERIDRETGRITSMDWEKTQLFDLDEAMMSPNPTILAFHKEVPASQVFQFAGMQAIVEHIVEAKRVHLIDLQIRSGMHCTALMQALAGRSECPVELLKVTAVGTKSKSTMEDTGKRLMNFAKSMNLPFSFSIVMVSDMLDLKEELFDLEAEETVVVNAIYALWIMLARPDRLESLMRVFRNISPCLMVVTEVEGNHNSPVFVNRFVEALFFYGSFFDCLEDCMKLDDLNRKISESMYFSQGIWNMVAAEGEERKIRHVSISVWRAFFARFGMVEEELSTSSLYQANLVLRKFSCGSSCTFHMDGKCLLLGWKGTPLHSLSVWKFT